MSGSWKKRKRLKGSFSMWNLVNRLWVVLRNCHTQIIHRCFIVKTLVNSKNILYKSNIAKVPWDTSKLFWRYQKSREEDVHVHTLSIYGGSVKWKKTINELDGNIPGVNFLGGNFLRGVGGFSRGEFDGWNFLGGDFRVGTLSRTAIHRIFV